MKQSQNLGWLKLSERKQPTQFSKQLPTQQKDVCLGCLKSMEQGQPIPHTTQLYSLVYGKSINGILYDFAKKKICALLNAQGGYLFISESTNKDSVIGIKLDNLELYQLRQFVIKTIKNSIFPETFEIKIDTLEVTKQNNKTSKVIIRVSLRPGGGNGFYFVKKEVLNYPSVYSCYFLDLNAVGKINDTCVLKHPEGIYKILTKHRSLKNTEQIVHKFGCISRNKAMENLLNQINRQSPKLIYLEKLSDTEPKISYLNQTILILPSDDDDKYIPLIKRAFEEYRMQFVFSKSYQQLCRNNSIKSMWFISHEQAVYELQPIITGVIANKDKKFKLITLTKYLLIEKKQSSSLRAYKKTFQSFFQKDLTIYGEFLDSSTKQQLYDFYIKFDSFSEAYFSFMLLDDHCIRSQFVKQNKFKLLKIKQVNIM